MSIHDPSLRAALKTLKLTGMLDTLDARLAQLFYPAAQVCPHVGHLGRRHRGTRRD